MVGLQFTTGWVLSDAALYSIVWITGICVIYKAFSSVLFVLSLVLATVQGVDCSNRTMIIIIKLL